MSDENTAVKQGLVVGKIVKIAVAVFVAATAIIALIFIGKEREQSVTHINSKIAELGCLKVKGQIVCFEEKSLGFEKAVFVYDADAVLSVNMAEHQKNGSELSLPSPRVIMAGINHNARENVYRKNNRYLRSMEEMEHAASKKAQAKIREIANSEDMKTLARQQAEFIIPAIFYPGEKIELKWRD